MSEIIFDEETGDDDNFVVHQLPWRVDGVTQLIEKIEISKLNEDSYKKQAKQRVLDNHLTRQSKVAQDLII